jgi:hypothetical protein
MDSKELILAQSCFDGTVLVLVLAIETKKNEYEHGQENEYEASSCFL